jgi:hypothetical protein
VDLHAGRVTRSHDDIDIAVWLSDLPRITRLLGEDGWVHAAQNGEDGGTGYERDGIRIELTFLERDGVEIFTRFGLGRGVWPDAASGSDERVLDGVRVRVLALPALRDGKRTIRGDDADQAKDRRDLAVLAYLRGSQA